MVIYCVFKSNLPKMLVTNYREKVENRSSQLIITLVRPPNHYEK